MSAEPSLEDGTSQVRFSSLFFTSQKRTDPDDIVQFLYLYLCHQVINSNLETNNAN
jgi:hypothetical protein